jgi:uncharacterized protein YggT (Ycf19 family)
MQLPLFCFVLGVGQSDSSPLHPAQLELTDPPAAFFRLADVQNQNDAMSLIVIALVNQFHHMMVTSVLQTYIATNLINNWMNPF